MVVIGLDISLDHAGIVALCDGGGVLDYCALTTVKKDSAADPRRVFLLSKQGKDESKDTFRLRRMKEISNFVSVFIDSVSDKVDSLYFSIEGYSYASYSTSICQIAELTGYLKYMLFDMGGYLRIHDPLSVKLFATGKGNCLKRDVVERAGKYLKFPESLIKKKQKKIRGKLVEEYDGLCTDLADAYFLARMLWTELQIRSGEIGLEQLSDGERRIFLRVTKGYPVNILDRPFICKEGGSD